MKTGAGCTALRIGCGVDVLPHSAGEMAAGCIKGCAACRAPYSFDLRSTCVQPVRHASRCNELLHYDDAALVLVAGGFGGGFDGRLDIANVCDMAVA